MNKKKIKAPSLDKYLEGREHTYITYEQGARRYSLPFWTFVKLAKEAKATWALRKTAIVDVELFEKYMEDCCSENDKGDEKNMPKARKEIENLEEMVKNKKKKYVRCSEGAELYSMGMHSFRSLANDAGAVRKVKGVVLINTEKVDEFIETFKEEEY